MSFLAEPFQSLFLDARLVRGERVRWAALHWLLAAAVAALVGATWRLWTPQSVFPQVPLLAAGLWIPAWIEWTAACVMVAAPLAAAVCVRQERTRRSALAAFVAAVIVLVVADQLRLQAWGYQFALVATVLALARPSRALGLCRLLLIGIYVHSAWTKFDYSFLHDLGPRLIAPLGVPESMRWLAAVLPAGELLIAAGLLLSKTRKAALVASVAMHVALLVVLGPWMRGDSLGVLLWNVFFIVQNVLLFWPLKVSGTPRVLPVITRSAMDTMSALIVVAALVLPLAEPWGGWDLWPSWGLYASRAERTIVWIRTSDETRVPEDIREHWFDASDDADWRQLNLQAWSLAALGVPLYPENRFQLGVASRVATVLGKNAQVRVRLAGRANRWTGERHCEDFSSQPQIQQRQAKFVFSATPGGNWPSGGAKP